MGHINRVLAVLVILLVASSANAAMKLRKSKSSNKQHQMMADSIAANNFKISLDRDTSVERKIDIINFIEQSKSVRRNLPTFRFKRYDLFTRSIETVDEPIKEKETPQLFSFVQTKNGKNVRLMNHGNTFYTGKIQVGNRDQDYKMIFDTGSTLIFLNSVQCDSIGCVRGNQYDSEKSPTFKDVNMEVEVEFGSGILHGEMAIDTFYIGNTDVEKVEFMEILEQKGAVFESGDFDGLIGLAFPSLGDGMETLVDYMKDQSLIEKKMFSFYMSRRDESETSFVSFGQIDQEMIRGDINYHQVSNPLYWSLQASEIRIGGRDSGLCSSEVPCALAIDSGTSIVAGPTNAIDHLANLILDRGYECHQIKEMPVISFIIDGEEYTLQPEEYMISSNGAMANMYEHDINPSECYPALIGLDIQEPELGSMWIMGDIFMSKYYTVFDREQRRIGFGKLNSIDNRFYQKPSGKNDSEFNYDVQKKVSKKHKKKQVVG